MKRRHRVPVIPARSAVVDAAYQREVDLATGRGEREHAAAVKRLEAAKRKALAAGAAAAQNPTPKASRAMAVAWELVELRRAELADLERLMIHVAASSAHRTAAAVRPVPVNHGSNL